MIQVWDSIKYCSFLLEAEVSDSALFSLSKEILNDKGPLPVGEIGKLLQEFTANAGLSQTLKDQFGGLKRFLEKFPDDFVISTDHPFNPHVYLKAGEFHIYTCYMFLFSVVLWHLIIYTAQLFTCLPHLLNDLHTCNLRDCLLPFIVTMHCTSNSND
jgi:hypothetical protein